MSSANIEYNLLIEREKNRVLQEQADAIVTNPPFSIKQKFLARSQLTFTGFEKESSLLREAA